MNKSTHSHNAAPFQLWALMCMLIFIKIVLRANKNLCGENANENVLKRFERMICGFFYVPQSCGFEFMPREPTSTMTLSYVALMALIIIRMKALGSFSIQIKQRLIRIQCQSTRFSYLNLLLIHKKISEFYSWVCFIMSSNCVENDQKNIKSRWWKLKRSFGVRCSCWWWSVALEKPTIQKIIHFDHIFFTQTMSTNFFVPCCYLKISHTKKWHWLIKSNSVLIWENVLYELVMSPKKCTPWLG